ncbi:transcription factor VIP1 [Marchantia polymorpha subsp. ruderalis]|uniref:BZIP domain-containing protein n=3 Tax=Marchantia polymorpha TaxID=3197 RepID=A0AAF6APG6_MARPO|nr:hypothetical protein MARPO_0019s0040 [Marchantia polymorpha]PTQ44603.1 hypothetical protein MARPO_0019s0040 [Marchantia polymorpha]BBM98335.1 hypothetical protein Mp_1g12700 [Marchantia polymorpha subsp. ruderalis]BBM98336.1 hypothetical protein Mp_1g12700 [Marchantia polymorpha subsp. ruderalis]|eukprot:PTQ44602.1 hypothetical protein MARPO_0019s0040 [Marchantia polymorpha]
MASQAKDGRAVNWSFPMNPHLPPKSPTFPSFGSSLFESTSGPFVGVGRSSYPNRGGGGHKRTPSAGYLPQVQPAWLDDVIDPQEVPFKRGSHRRSSSDSVAFLEAPGSFSKIDDHIAEEDEFDARSVVSIPSGRGSLDFELSEEQLMSMFTDMEPSQQSSKASHQNQQSEGARAQSGSNAVSSSAADSWTSERRTPATTPENPSTPSDSNSLSEVSNEERGLGRMKSEPEVQSVGEGEGASSQQPSKGELQSLSSQIDPNLDPKRAKRILANRQSAQRSRVRKLQYISELERSVHALQTEVSTLSPQVAFLDHQRVVLNVDNNSLKQKIAALSQDKRFKEAHNDALKKEVQRLRQLYQQQQQHHMQQQQLQQHIQQQQQQLQSSTPAAYELQQQQFSKLDLGSAESKQVGADAFCALNKGSNGVQSVNGPGPVPAQRSNVRPMVIKNVVPSGCMAPGSTKGMDGRLMNGGGPLQSDFMVHNP